MSASAQLAGSTAENGAAWQPVGVVPTHISILAAPVKPDQVPESPVGDARYPPP